jgi:hypothetical protein
MQKLGAFALLSLSSQTRGRSDAARRHQTSVDPRPGTVNPKLKTILREANPSAMIYKKQDTITSSYT